jgi:hypothetical protein
MKYKNKDGKEAKIIEGPMIDCDACEMVSSSFSIRTGPMRQLQCGNCNEVFEYEQDEEITIRFD